MAELMKKEEALQYLEEVRDVLTERQTAVLQRKAQEKEVEQLESVLQKEQRALDNQIRKTISKRRGELEAGYDKQIRNLQEALEQAKKKRETEKEKAIVLRIEAETQEIREEKTGLKEELGAVYKSHHVPFLCRTNLYYALHCPGSFGDVLTILLYLMVLYLLLPAGLIFFLTDHSTKFIILIFLVDIVLFGGLYLLIHSSTRNRYGDALLEGRSIRKKIHKIEKEQRKAEKMIRKDPDEEAYHLQDYDAEIRERQEALEGKKQDREEAIQRFEAETEEQIRTEVSEEYDDRISTIEEALEEELQELQTSRQDEQYFEEKLQGVCGDSLEPEFLEERQIERLIQAMEDGAPDLTEAMAIVKQGNTSQK